MRHLLLLPCPDNELGRVSKVSARDIGRRICLSPRNDIQDFESQLRQLVCHGEDIVIGSRYPDGTILLQMFPASRNPLLVELVDMFRRTALVPFTFIHAHHLSALHADTAVGEEVRRIGEDHVELEIKFAHQPDTVSLEESEIVSPMIYRLFVHHFGCKDNVNI